VAAKKRHLILGFCTKYRLEQIEPFLASALAIGEHVQLCLFTSGMEERFYHLAADRGIRVKDAAPYLETEYHPQNSRYFAYRDFLRRAGEEYDRVLICDVRDLFFQSDPFAVQYPGPVCFSLEDTRIEWETLNQGWLRDLYGDEVLASVAPNYVACSGTILGTVGGIRLYLDVLCKEMEIRHFDRMKVYDQGIHNYIVWKLRPNWGWVDTADSIVSTVGCTPPEKIEILGDLAVIEGKVPPVVHQWDRHPMLKTYLDAYPRFKLHS
jgi:hypothetical protein